jgi:hypothetical protein
MGKRRDILNFHLSLARNNALEMMMDGDKNHGKFD